MSVKDFLSLRRWLKEQDKEQILILKMKELKNFPVKLRPNTSDWATLQDILLKRNNIPTIELSGNPVIMDLGCYVGYTICQFAAAYPHASIVGVEMDTGNYRLAQENTGHIKNCILMNLAISTSNGFIRYDKDNEKDAFHIEKGKIDKTEKIATVESITMNSLFKRLKLDHIDYLKMDIEGEEVNIFKENIECLRWLERIGLMHVEIHTNREDLEKIRMILEQFHFETWPDRLHKSALFAKKLSYHKNQAKTINKSLKDVFH